MVKTALVKPWSSSLLAALIGLLAAAPLSASPEEDLRADRAHYRKLFPDLPLQAFGNGSYALRADYREQWEEIEEFPPYEQFVEQGELLWQTPFSDGAGYASCFGDDAAAVRTRYPRFDEQRGEVLTLEMAVNECREEHGLQPLSWEVGDLAHISAYLGYQARGRRIDVKLGSPGAVTAYETGKQFFYTKRGQLNFSCADCHETYAGRYLRTELISPALGHPTHQPVFRLNWAERSLEGDGLGTTHRRYRRCVKQMRAGPFLPQGEEYRHLEFYQNYMSNGLEINAPGYRK